MTTLTNLIERVEHAEEGSRELDAEIMRLDDPEFRMHPRGITAWRGNLCLGSAVHVLPAYTTSLDAAKALLEKVLPGWYMMIDGSLMTSFEVSLTDSSVPSAEVREDVSRFFARGATLPLAILAALLRSKLSESPLASEGG